MLFLILPLCVSVRTPNAPEENLISLRDYDFVGEDKRLTSLLAARMVMMQTHINIDVNVTTHHHTTRKPVKFQPDFKPSPDQLHLNLRRYPAVNVSMDYAELFNTSGEFNLDNNASWITPPSGAATPDISNQLGLVYDNITGNGTSNVRANLRSYQDHSFFSYNMKILDIMKQNIYMVQNRLLEIEPITQKYQKDERFRIAFIYNMIDEWMRDLRTIYFAMKKERSPRFPFHKNILYYTHALRKNIDITYSIEFLIHLHTSYLQMLDDKLPRKQREEMVAAKKKKEEMKKQQQG